MRLHLVGGFLGSGKTTAIARAARLLASEEVRVAVVTNDQGKNLVDSLFMDLQQTPRTEVTDGCFCCRFEDFTSKLISLAAEVRPDLIFAEAVGSCADIVSTVVSPMIKSLDAPYLKALGFEGKPTFSVFCDARLLALRLAGRKLPFSDDLCYLFDRQLAEAGLIVVNKTDLLDGAERDRLADAIERQFPGQPWRFQSSLNNADIGAWVGLLKNSGQEFTGHPEAIDYERYGKAESSLAWADVVVDFWCEDETKELGRPFDAFFKGLAADTAKRVGPIGHAKAFYGDGRQGAKVSIVSIGENSGTKQDPSPFFGHLHATLNMRIEGPAAALESLVREALCTYAKKEGLRMQISVMNVFSPLPPQAPVHRS
ncbi:MAG: CobW-like GTP-binding protein [Spirochaetaceae bacterium]|nr:CobW-like GTP-binding protein [Spirochaetaceae bacterium]